MSNKSVVASTAKSLARAFKKELKKKAAYWYFLTVTDATWLTSDHSPVIPIHAIKTRLKRMMRRTELQWLGAIEVDLCINLRAYDLGVAVMPHAHIVAWSHKPLDAAELGKKLSRQLKSPLGLDQVIVKEIPTLPDLMHVTYYLMKPNHSIKSRNRAKDGAEPNRMYHVETAAKPRYVTRLSEIRSHLQLDNVLIGGREGALLKRRVLRKMQRWLKKQAGNAVIMPIDVSTLWGEYRAGGRQTSYQSVEFDCHLS